MSSLAVSVDALPAVYSFTASSSTPAVVYTVPRRLYSSPIQLTLNLCNAPDAYNQSDRAIFTAYTNSSFAYAKAIRAGFANLTIPLTQDNDDEAQQQLTVAIDAAGQDSPQDYTFELAITAQPDLPWHALDKLPLFAFEDADNTTALFTSPTYSSVEFETPPSYNPVVLLSDIARPDLSSSVCYIRSLNSTASISSKSTTRGVIELTKEEGGWDGETDQKGRKLQYTASDLQIASNYSLWGVSTTDQGGSRLYQKQYFATKRDDVCRLVVDVPFCPDVAYSVPAPPSMSNEDLFDLYQANITPIMNNFNTTLTTFPCDGDLRKKQGMYSPVRTCSQCRSAYQSWLCSIRMPRCTDYVEAPSSSEDDEDEDAIRTFPRTSSNTSRTPFLPQSAFPYSEIPPCIDVCSIVRASCPPLISNTFQCPLKKITMEQSYSTPFTSQIIFENVQGGDDPSFLSTTMTEDNDDYITKSKDRYGNVKCNDMGVLNLVERRKWSGLTKDAIVSSRSSATSNAHGLNFVAMSFTVACISTIIVVIV